MYVSLLVGIFFMSQGCVAREALAHSDAYLPALFLK